MMVICPHKPRADELIQGPSGPGLVTFANALKQAKEGEAEFFSASKNALVSTKGRASWAAPVLRSWWEVRFLPRPRGRAPLVCMWWEVFGWLNAAALLTAVKF